MGVPFTIEDVYISYSQCINTNGIQSISRDGYIRVVKQGTLCVYIAYSVQGKRGVRLFCKLGLTNLYNFAPGRGRRGKG